MDLYFDAVIEILSRLQVKSLLRFRSVCKSWRNTIDSSSFRKSHYKSRNEDDEDRLFLRFYFDEKRNKCNFSIINQDNGKLLRFSSFQGFLNDYKSTAGQLRLVGPVNGLICMYNLMMIPYDKTRWLRTCTPCTAVCNPFLNQIKILPVSPCCGYLLQKCALESRYIGLGFDYVAKDYKIVQLITSWGGYMYSGKTNMWKRLTALEDGLTPMHYATSHELNSTDCGWAHWMTEIRENEPVVVSFDMQNEVFETMLLPRFEDSYVLEVFAKSSDLFILFVRHEKRKLEVWELQRKGGLTTHIARINLQSREEPWPKVLRKDWVVLTWKDLDKKIEYVVFYDYCTHTQIKCLELPYNNLWWSLKILDYKCTFYILDIC